VPEDPEAGRPQRSVADAVVRLRPCPPMAWPIEQIHAGCGTPLTFVLARRASHSLMREAVDFYTPSVDETAESHARFRDAMQRFNRIVSAYAGLVYWNEAKEHVFMVQGGPLYHDVGLLTKAVAYEFEKIEREVRRHPELFLDEETATQFQFNSKIFPATPVHAAA